MRPEIAPKHIRVKDGPEVAATRSFGGLGGAVLYAGAFSRSYSIGADGSPYTHPVTFTDLEADSLVRFQYTVRTYFEAGDGLVSINMRLALDLLHTTPELNANQGTAVIGSSYSSRRCRFYDVGQPFTGFFSGTAIIPAGTHTVAPWFNANLTIGQKSTGLLGLDVSESWVIDILDKTSNDAFNVSQPTALNGSGVVNTKANLGESFNWIPFEEEAFG